MHVITRKRLRDFWTVHPDAESTLRSWIAIIRLKKYRTPNEVRRDFSTANFLGNWRTVFIGGNKYRLVVDMRYDLGRVYIRHVLTHTTTVKHGTGLCKPEAL